MLALLAPYSQATVLGTSLLAMIPPSLAALVQHHRWGELCLSSFQWEEPGFGPRGLGFTCKVP